MNCALLKCTTSVSDCFAYPVRNVVCYIIQAFNVRIYIFIYLGSYIAFNTVRVISRWVVRTAEETSKYSWSRFCTVNCRPTATNYQLSHLRPCREPNPGLRGGRRECYHSATVAPKGLLELVRNRNQLIYCSD